MSLSFNDKIEIIRNYPLFSKLTSGELGELAKLFKEQQVEPNKIIVNEGDPVDSIYLIASGAAEITRKATSITENEVYNVATLMKGDAIGLSQEGFFSQTGLRAGTVISALAMTLLAITLDDLYQFLQKSAHLSSLLSEACENILLINFIKKSHLFSHLDSIQIQQLIKKKQKISLTAGTILFKENEAAHKCYFILSGKISITTHEVLLATLGPSDVFGEAAFIAGGKRNANAIAETHCVLFVLDSEEVKLINSTQLQHKIDESLINQLRPLPREVTSVIEDKTPDKERMIFLYNSVNHAKLLLSNTDYVIWKNLDGKKSLLSILRDNSQALNNMSIQEMHGRILEMENAEFLDIKKKTFINTMIEKIQLAW